MVEIEATGRLIREPILREIEKSKKKSKKKLKLCQFYILCYSAQKEKNFLRVAVWENLAVEMFNELSKGDKITVKGDLIMPDFHKNANHRYPPYLTVKEYKIVEKATIKNNENTSENAIDEEEIF